MDDSPYQFESLPEVVRDFLLSLKPLFKFIEFARRPGSAAAIGQAFEDWERHFREQDQVLLAFAIKQSLIGVERHFTSQQLWLMVRWAAERGEDEPNRRLPEMFPVEQIEKMVSGWASTVPHVPGNERCPCAACRLERKATDVPRRRGRPSRSAAGVL